MEYYKNRIDSFGTTKSKRSKASSSKQPAWPHPSSFKATPKTLAEAGFYFNPDSDNDDNVACFMCGKNLAGWESDDDPFAIHYDKCHDKCSWAVVRCQTALSDGSFDFSDPARHPTSKPMEKARLESFAKARWPHDAVKGHGANSKAMAKAGFLCIASEAGDDTALCLYCELSLSGWDEEDDPYEEHTKRDKKNKTSCQFITAYAGNSLSKSTAKRPTSKAASKPRSVSQSSRAAAAREAMEEVEDSDDELAAEAEDISVPTKTSGGRASRASSARSSVAKTPASRRSTRGTGTTGKTPGSRTVSSEVDETDPGSESDAGRRTTKSKRKPGKQTKARVSAIAEEEDEAESSKPTREVEEDVEMEDAEPEPEPEPVEKEKKKRGRPPKSAAAKPTAKAKSKKAEVKVAEEEDGEEDGAESSRAAPVKKTHARTRSKANLESDAEAAAPTSSKNTHTRTKSTSKAKVKQEDDDDDPLVAPAPAPVLKKKGKERAVEVVQDEEDPPSAPPAKPKGKAMSRSKTKPKPESEGADVEDAIAPSPDGSSRDRVDSAQSAASHESKVASERKSSLSEDAGYATADAPVETDRMEVDDEPAPPPPKPTKKSQPHSSAAQPLSRTNSRSTPSGSDISQRPSPVINGVRSSSAVPPSSRTSSSRPPSKLSVKDSLKVVEIDSDGDNSPERPLKAQPMAKPPLSRTESTTSVNGAKKPASQTFKKKLQVEVVVPPKAPARASSKDVQMHVEPPVSPPPRPPRSPARPTKPEIPAPGTPVSAVHRSAHPSPERDNGADEDVRMGEEMDTATASASPRTYHPFLAQLPIEKLVNLTEEETEMTLEQYIRQQMELQYAQLKADGERHIEEFRQKAAETRSLIEMS